MSIVNNLFRAPGTGTDLEEQVGIVADMTAMLRKFARRDNHACRNHAVLRLFYKDRGDFLCLSK